MSSKKIESMSNTELREEIKELFVHHKNTLEILDAAKTEIESLSSVLLVTARWLMDNNNFDGSPLKDEMMKLIEKRNQSQITH